MSANRCAPVPWDELPESATRSVIWWVHRLAEGTSSLISFQCHEGGIRSVTVEEVVERHEDGSRQIRVRTYAPGELNENGRG